MKKLILILIFLLLPGIVAFFTLNALYKQTNYWQHIDDEAERFNHVPDHIKLTTLGSSCASWGIKFEDYTDINAFNLAVICQTFHLDWNMLQQFASKLDSGCVVIIPVSYNQITFFSADGKGYLKTYYHFMNKENLNTWSWKEYLRYSVFPILDKKDFLFDIIKDIKKDEISRFRHQNKSVYELEKEAISVIGNSEWGHNGDEGYSGFDHNIQAISKLIDFCYEHKFVPVLVTIPMPDALNDEYDKQWPEFWDWFYRFTDTLKEKYPEIQYFDYSHDADISSEAELFVDSVHLNVYGAEKFTARLIDDFREAGLVPRAE